MRGGQLWGTDIYTNDSDLVAGLSLMFNIFVSQLRHHVTVPCYGSCYGTLQDKIRVNMENIRSLERWFLFATYGAGSLRENLQSLELKYSKTGITFCIPFTEFK